MPNDLRVGSHVPAIDIPASSPASPVSPVAPVSPVSPHSSPGSPRPSSISHPASSFGRLGALKDLGAARAQRAAASPRAGPAGAASGPAHQPSGPQPPSSHPLRPPHDARFNYGKHGVPAFQGTRFFGFPQPLRTRFSAAWPQGRFNHDAHFNHGFNWGFGGSLGLSRFALPAMGMFLGADLGMMAGAAIGADLLMPGCFTPDLGGDAGFDPRLGLMGGAALGALGWEAGRYLLNRPFGGQLAGNAYEAHYTHPPHGGDAVQNAGGYAPYPAYGGGPGWGEMLTSAAIGGLAFGAGEALGAGLMFDALF